MSIRCDEGGVAGARRRGIVTASMHITQQHHTGRRVSDGCQMGVGSHSSITQGDGCQDRVISTSPLITHTCIQVLRHALSWRGVLVTMGVRWVSDGCRMCTRRVSDQGPSHLVPGLLPEPARLAGGLAFRGSSLKSEEASQGERRKFSTYHPS